ncbi:hypothetical protein KSP40_PGU000328 [Platanthera guangdongensis]|uniref:Uncharacterized protein n=1 Tax=Platanthera guangdongensis TaxID=2320717 RepID=A0ABR2LKH3_9ASPA
MRERSLSSFCQYFRALLYLWVALVLGTKHLWWKVPLRTRLIIQRALRCFGFRVLDLRICKQFKLTWYMILYAQLYYSLSV